MTNKEKLIQDITASTCGNYTEEEVKQVFNIVNKRDWAIFCSQMGDYDHPGERVQAHEAFVKELAEFANEGKARELAERIEKDTFYHQKFHTMNEEYSD